MFVRDDVVITLYQELIGPRSGFKEILQYDHDPANEYILGVLAPKNAGEERDVDNDSELLVEGAGSEEDTDGDTPILTDSPVLNPKNPPKSMGISFCIEASKDLPAIEICVTWARYKNSSSGWEREPYIYLTGKTVVQNYRRWDLPDNVVLEMRGRQLDVHGKLWRISLYIINATPIQSGKRPSTDQLIFQSQIRVCLYGDTRLRPLSTYLKNMNNFTSENQSLELLYRDRVGMARGHLTGAYWKDIDPERAHKSIQLPGTEPFCWVDGQALKSKERSKFSPADIRTDFFPMYPVESPKMEWDIKYGPSPELNPAVLAQCWEPEQMKNSLEPLVEGYKNWLNQLVKDIQKLDSRFAQTAQKHRRAIEETIKRIQNSIDLILIDSDVRLSFCFANKAIALQAKWNNKTLIWRPFQLAFILLNISSIVNAHHFDRKICDLLWFPTGGGKTEAYLGLTAFTIGLRALRSPLDTSKHRVGSGTGVISRYTLRLLTIQQFRRALGVITACEYLRVYGLSLKNKPTGWRPVDCNNSDDFLWGARRFSAGMWVGGSITPNSLQTITFPEPSGKLITIHGALDILKKKQSKTEGEPAQVLSCPCCGSILAVPDEDGLGSGKHKLHLVFKGPSKLRVPSTTQLSYQNLVINNVSIYDHPNKAYHTISIDFDIPNSFEMHDTNFTDWWERVISPALGGVTLRAARPARPGYFIRYFLNSRTNLKHYNFDIICPNPYCELNGGEWLEKVPVAIDCQVISSSTDTEIQEVIDAFQVPGKPRSSNRIPIPAYTVDDQIYHRVPSVLISTVDKFARLAFEPKAASIFGNVEYYHSRWGYYREGCIPSTGAFPQTPMSHPPGGGPRNPYHKQVKRFPIPDLIIQDELHLIEGPLGSMVGIYETAIETLCKDQVSKGDIIPKYIASTATVREAETQIQGLFNRKLNQFPPPGLSINDNFFSKTSESHPLDCMEPGRLYIGICPPGKGAQTPIVRIWSSLLQVCEELIRSGVSPNEVDNFWTLVGYFNAVRELAGAASLYRQDIPERMEFIKPYSCRQLKEKPVELSSRCEPTELPGLLDDLARELPDPSAEDAVLATSMFGTGVDVNRLGLMVVHGQPKTTSTYIQATGRVGRKKGGLVIAFLRAARPRDLNHYEFFTCYHRALYMNVEPVAIAPFSPRARERAVGPISVALLRQIEKINGKHVDRRLRLQQRFSGGCLCYASQMRMLRMDPAVLELPSIFENRAQTQPAGRKPITGVVQLEVTSELDKWANMSARYSSIIYYESSMVKTPQSPVVLGDPQHQLNKLPVVYENAPGSLRDVEATTRFKG